jgi:hypothetical protein
MTVAAPVMSYFISSMFSPGFREMPPESNVIPFPTSASRPFDLTLRGGVYFRTMSFGGSSDPRETPRNDPMPSFSICF